MKITMTREEIDRKTELLRELRAMELLNPIYANLGENNKTYHFGLYPHAGDSIEALRGRIIGEPLRAAVEEYRKFLRSEIGLEDDK